MQVCNPQEICQAHSQYPPHSTVPLEKPLACLALISLTALLCSLFSVNIVLNIYNFDETTTKALAEVWPEVSAGLNV